MQAIQRGSFALFCRVPPVLSEWNIGRSHIGTQNLLQGLWQELGVGVPWALAVHVYGDVDAKELNGENGVVDAYGWNTIGDVADWQSAQLAAGLQADPSAPYTLQNAPHRILVASEQGWQGSQNGPEERAKLVCKAWGHGNAVPNLAWITFMSFQEIGTDDFGLVPADATLSNAQASPIYRAFLSTAPDTWGKNSDHYCCFAERLGCAS